MGGELRVIKIFLSTLYHSLSSGTKAIRRRKIMRKRKEKDTDRSG